MYYGHRGKLYQSAKFYYSILIISQDWLFIIVEGGSIIQTSSSLKVQGACHCFKSGEGWSEIVSVAKKATAQDRGEINIERWAKRSPHCKRMLKAGSKQEIRNIKVTQYWKISATAFSCLLNTVHTKVCQCRGILVSLRGRESAKTRTATIQFKKTAMSTENNNMVYSIPQGWSWLFLNNFFFCHFFPPISAFSFSFLSIVQSFYQNHILKFGWPLLLSLYLPAQDHFHQ